MPPGPAYNWFCVAHSVVDVLSHAAHFRAAQIAKTARLSGRLSGNKERDESYAAGDYAPGDRDEVPTTADVSTRLPGAVDVASLSLRKSSTSTNAQEIDLSKEPSETPHSTLVQPPLSIVGDAGPSRASAISSDYVTRSLDSINTITPLPSRSAPASQDSTISVGDLSASSTGIPSPDPAEVMAFDRSKSRNLQASKVPSSRIGRLFHYGGLAASLGYGAASELLRRSTSSSDETVASSLMLTEGNVKRLVTKLTQMRGAALKLGQFMSIQDSHVLPPEIEDIFRRVQDSAHYMPDWQMEKVLQDSLGPSWMDNFESFDRLPFAAASIGQVHSAVLAAAVSPTGQPARVAVKVQFPNIVNSIDSDLGYVRMLLTASKLLPRGLFLDRTIQVMKEELADECNYTREASFLKRFGGKDHLGADPRFKIPWVCAASTDRVLIMEHVDGVSVGGSVIDRLTQQDRNDIAERVIDLCLRELFVYRVMQTDPNWSNFLWNPRTRQVELIDFGATREYSKEFIDDWLRLLSSAVSEDRDGCIEWSLKLGYLTGGENDIMVDAHVKSMVLIGTPFKESTPQPFTFGPGSAFADITAQIRAQIPVMLNHRLTPPPRETYSLNRKLSGAFLLASRLRASVDCRTLWKNVVDGYRFGQDVD